jgi:hypothetical protein
MNAQKRVRPESIAAAKDRQTKTPVAAQEEAAPARDLYAPFGPMEPPGEVQSARIHIRNTYAGCMGQKWDDAASFMIDLAFCLEGNHALSIEREALKSISGGVDDINEYWKARMGKLTGAESWLARKLRDGDILMEAAWDVLFEARPLIADNPASAELFQIIESMVDGKIIMNKIDNWLELL